MTFFSILIVFIVGYLIGSVSFSVIIARSHGIDIFKEGSGNPGATNIKRVLGAKWGNLTFFLDAIKGYVASSWHLLIFGGDNYLAIIGILAAILGHSFSIFLKFRGGKGVATAMGGLFAIMWVVLLVGIAVWFITFFFSKIVALASIFFAISLPIAAFFILGLDDHRLYLSLILCLFIVVRHHSNIIRILTGKEKSF